MQPRPSVGGIGFKLLNTTGKGLSRRVFAGRLELEPHEPFRGDDPREIGQTWRTPPPPLLQRDQAERVRASLNAF